ncbi:uncharacterized protein LOC116603023 [Nematostella vectensis]|uniref:uncharacterized protein LOC116603023 n=1 Tax=Nematostella vectensis TaxID=45351 RepID=UPI0013901482|nr:uncharacterized protein LOC116603023 [Nematostella vectensis]
MAAALRNLRDGFIKEYFHMGFSCKEISSCLLFDHGIQLSERQIKRILAKQSLGRRRFSDFDDIIKTIEDELKGSGSIVGYRTMWQKLIVDHHLSVSKEFVRNALLILDPDGVERRSRNRLRRRQYHAKGANFFWHLDGYDKLKPYGFCIHGCIDGYSRRIMWLEVGRTNNHPGVVASYFLDCVESVGGTARIVRGDMGTENGRVAAIQRFLQDEAEDSWSGEKSFLYGRSVSNQRIEAWWGQLRKGSSEWWIQHFKDLRDRGLFCDADAVHVECLKFCYMGVLQRELQSVARRWNIHRIRPSTRSNISPPGRPCFLYHYPEMTGGQECRFNVDADDLDVARELCCHDLPQNSSPDFTELAELIMREEGLRMPENGNDARALYLTLIHEIERIM